MARMRLKVVPKMTSQRIGWMARVSSSVRSWRSFCSSTRQNVPTRETSSRGPVRLTRSAEAARGSTSCPDTAQPSLLLTLERVAGVVAEDVLEGGALTRRGLEVVGSAEGAQRAVVHERDAVAQRVRLLHVVRREHDGHAVVALHLVDALPDAVARHRVQAHGRLVE